MMMMMMDSLIIQRLKKIYIYYCCDYSIFSSNCLKDNKIKYKNCIITITIPNVQLIQIITLYSVIHN